ncbi:MAG TPA: hypothetical protein VFL82_16970 [Thermomicrobiales bacterium]|nr:hypothetical protein [Thermomicrobiales bacterium]
MVAEAKVINVEPDSELAHLLDDAGDRPLVLIKGRERFRITRESTEETPKDDPWANYDPDKLMEGVRAAAGAWADVDTEALKENIYRWREEGSRPSNRP